MHIKDTFPELYQIRKRPVSIEGVRAKLAGQARARVLAEPRRAGRDAGVRGASAPGVPAARLRVGRGRRPPHVPQADGRVARARGAGGLLVPAARDHRPLRPPARGDRPRQGALLRDRDAFPRRRGAAARAQLHGAPRSRSRGTTSTRLAMGAADLFAQASVLDLYDPDRSQTIINRGEVRPYTAFLGDILTALEGQRGKQGAGLRFLTETVTSPTVGAQMRDILRRFPGARWYQWEPAGGNNGSLGVRQAAGGFATPVYNFAAADRVLSLDSNFLECGPGALRYARDFASRRRATRRRRARDLPPLRHRDDADQHGLLRRPPRRAHVRASSPLTCAASRRPWARRAPRSRAARPRPTTRSSKIAADLKAHNGRVPRHRGRRAAAGDSRPRARDERGARRDRARPSTTSSRSRRTRPTS